MSLPLVIRRTARAEFDHALDWYEAQRPGLGFEFSERVHAVFDTIAANPEQTALIEGDARKVRVRPFPYSVIYRIRGGRVVVIGVFHDKRNPKNWQSRS